MKPKIKISEFDKKLGQFLLSAKVVSAKEVCHELDISQSVFSRLLKKTQLKLFVFGKARATKYALVRCIDGVSSSLPLYEVFKDGSSMQLATLHAIEPKGFYVESQNLKIHQKHFENLPYFLEDLRPSGFLGRILAKQYEFLNHPQDIRLWSDSDCLRFLSSYGSDMIGNYILGDRAFQKYLDQKQKKKSNQKKNREIYYEDMAEHVLDMGPTGSSAAGEQPKFLTHSTFGNSVIVKFSPQMKTETSKRVADLLVCEHIAHRVLDQFEIEATRSEIIKGDKRIFLELTRFDRTGQGRLGVLSLQSLNLEFVGSTEAWPSVSEALLKQRLLTREVHKKICFLDLFGRLIANTDRHMGNVSFLTRSLDILDLAPVYDMLPMWYMPQHEHMQMKTMGLPSVHPKDAYVWQRAWRAAVLFWQRVGEHELVSKKFKEIALQNMKVVERLKEDFVMLPK